MICTLFQMASAHSEKLILSSSVKANGTCNINQSFECILQGATLKDSNPESFMSYREWGRPKLSTHFIMMSIIILTNNKSQCRMIKSIQGLHLTVVTKTHVTQALMMIKRFYLDYMLSYCCICYMYITMQRSVHAQQEQSLKFSIAPFVYNTVHNSFISIKMYITPICRRSTSSL